MSRVRYVCAGSLEAEGDGQESILTTEIYTHIDTKTWQKEVREHHPRG